MWGLTVELCYANILRESPLQVHAGAFILQVLCVRRSPLVALFFLHVSSKRGPTCARGIKHALVSRVSGPLITRLRMPKGAGRAVG